MQLARACHLPAASVEYFPALQSCLVERYDRLKGADGKFKRLYQADLCQLLDKPSGVKYENDGGPSFRDCYSLIKSRSSLPLTDCHNVVRWLFFNLMVGNNDSHAKNLSMLKSDGKLRLAPFYDLMCTQVYSGLSNSFAFKVGDHFEPGQIGYEDLCELADSIGTSRRILHTIAIDVAEQIEKNLPGRIEALMPLTDNGSSEQVLLNRVSMFIDSNIRKIKLRLQR